MNVWTDTKPRPRGYKPANNTKAPRTRTGQAFPGGKPLRRALKALSLRQNAYAPTSKPSGHAQVKPGAMTGKF